MQLKLLLIPTKEKLVPRKFAFGCKFLVLTNQDDDDEAPPMSWIMIKNPNVMLISIITYLSFMIFLEQNIP